MSIRNRHHEIQDFAQLAGYIEKGRGRVKGRIFEPDANSEVTSDTGTIRKGTFKPVVRFPDSNREHVGIDFVPNDRAVRSIEIDQHFAAAGLAISVKSRHSIPPQIPQPPIA